MSASAPQEKTTSRNPAQEVQLSQEQYAQLFRCMDREAKASLIAALLVTLFFWGAIFLTHTSTISFFYMPLWFVLSCLGGYLVSVGAVIILVKFFMRNLELKVSSIKRGDADHD